MLKRRPSWPAGSHTVRNPSQDGIAVGGSGKSTLTRNLNRRFDAAAAKGRLADLGIPLYKKTGKLSGGQQAQVALTMALARRPRLLILDEPLIAGTIWLVRRHAV